MVATTTMSTKGQLIIPKAIRDRHGWGPGAELEVHDQGDVVVIQRARNLPLTTLDAVRGCLRHDGPALSLEDMELAVERAAREQRKDR